VERLIVDETHVWREPRDANYLALLAAVPSRGLLFSTADEGGCCGDPGDCAGVSCGGAAVR
jgi:hypothetical protein